VSLSSHGKKGRAQYERAKRQEYVGNQALKLLAEDQGIDPVSGLHVRVADLGQETPANYTSEFNDMLKEVLSKTTPKLQLLAECIWVYASPANKKMPTNDVPKQFISFLLERRPQLRNAFESVKPGWDRDRIFCLNSCFYRHLATPLFLRGFEPQIVAAVTYGDLMYRVYLYLDWELFGSTIKNAGADFVVLPLLRTKFRKFSLKDRLSRSLTQISFKCYSTVLRRVPWLTS